MKNQSQWWSNKVFGAIVVLGVAFLVVQMVSAYLYPRTATLYLGEGAFVAQVANTDRTRTKGLSDTARLPADEVMLFVFDNDSKWGIWMKDMHYSLDIVWLDESKKVVDMALGVSPESYPKVFIPKKEARYVVELVAGTVKKEAIREGQQAVFDDTWRKP